MFAVADHDPEGDDGRDDIPDDGLLHHRQVPRQPDDEGHQGEEKGRRDDIGDAPRFQGNGTHVGKSFSTGARKGLASACFGAGFG